MKFLAHTVAIPMELDMSRYAHLQNMAIRAWWDEREDWLELMGQGTWHIYRVGEAFTCRINRVTPPAGNHNIKDVVIFTFSDAATAALFKLTFS